MKRKIIRFVVIVLSLIIMLELLTQLGTSIVVKRINESSNENFILQIDEVDFSLWRRSVSVNGLRFESNSKADFKSSLSGQIDKLSIGGVSFFNLIFSKTVKTSYILIDSPQFNIISSTEQKTVNNSKVLNAFWKDIFHSIEVDKIQLSNGFMQSRDSGQSEVGFSIENLDFEMTDVYVDSVKTTNPLPFDYESFSLNFDNLYAKAGEYYELEIDSFASNNNTLLVEQLKLKPIYDRETFDAKIKKEQDLFEAKIDSIRMDETNWSFRKDSLLIHADSLIVYQPILELYRNKALPDDTSYKKLYSQVLRELPFFIDIMNLSIRNGSLNYSELRENRDIAGEIKFRKIQGLGSNLSNLNYQQDSLPFTIHLEAFFFDQALLNSEFSFYVKDLNNAYNLQGDLSNLDLDKMNRFTVYNMGVGLSGHLNRINFNIHADDDIAYINASSSIENLKIQVYGAKGQKRSFLSATGNLFIKNQIEKSNTTAKVERNKQKSMFNQIIRSFMAVMKKDAI